MDISFKGSPWLCKTAAGQTGSLGTWLAGSRVDWLRTAAAAAAGRTGTMGSSSEGSLRLLITTDAGQTGSLGIRLALGIFSRLRWSTGKLGVTGMLRVTGSPAAVTGTMAAAAAARGWWPIVRLAGTMALQPASLICNGWHVSWRPGRTRGQPSGKELYWNGRQDRTSF